MTALYELSALAAACAIRAGTISSEELVRESLGHIAAADPNVEAWAFLDPEYALEQARRVDGERRAGRGLGPLHGVPVGVKDVFDTEDMPTENGTVLHVGRRHYLGQLPGRNGVEKRLTRLWNFERNSVPAKRGGQYFFSRNSGLQNQSVLYVVSRLDAEPRILLDPNTLSADGTVALSDTEVTDDGTLMAYSLATAGSDWNEIRVREVASGQDLPDVIKWVKFSGASWTKDGKGFFYSRYDEPKEGNALQDVNYFQKLYYHRIGTPQSGDVLVYHRPDQKEWGFGGAVTEDGRYLIISVWQGTARENRVFYQELGAAQSIAIEYSKYGSPDVLHLQEIERPTPKDDESLVNVHAASLMRLI